MKVCVGLETKLLLMLLLIDSDGYLSKEKVIR